MYISVTCCIQGVLIGDELATALVVDNGSGVKAGISGEGWPRVIFPSVVGQPSHQVLFYSLI